MNRRSVQRSVPAKASDEYTSKHMGESVSSPLRFLRFETLLQRHSQGGPGVLHGLKQFEQ